MATPCNQPAVCGVREHRSPAAASRCALATLRGRLSTDVLVPPRPEPRDSDDALDDLRAALGGDRDLDREEERRAAAEAERDRVDPDRQLVVEHDTIPEFDEIHRHAHAFATKIGLTGDRAERYADWYPRHAAEFYRDPSRNFYPSHPAAFEDFAAETCRECGDELDGDSYDGYCGNCADVLEREGRWS